MQQVALKEHKRDVYKEWYDDAFQTVLANVYPVSSSTAAYIYGEKTRDMKLMLVPASIILSERLGVCVDVSPEAYPDYRITGKPEAWRTHTRAYLELIPEHERVTQDEA